LPVALAQRSAMGQNTVLNLLERQVALANIQPLSTTDVFRSVLPEAAQCRDWPESSSRPPLAVSSTGRLSSARKSGRCGRARYCREAMLKRWITFPVVGTSSSDSEDFRNRRQLETCYVCVLQHASPNQMSVWQVLRPEGFQNELWVVSYDQRPREFWDLAGRAKLKRETEDRASRRDDSAQGPEVGRRRAHMLQTKVFTFSMNAPWIGLPQSNCVTLVTKCCDASHHEPPLIRRFWCWTRHLAQARDSSAVQPRPTASKC